MIDSLFKLSETAVLAKGELLASDGSVVINNFCIDSRAVEECDLFIPLSGENTDGHFFIANAVKGGCSAFLCSDSYYLEHKVKITALAEKCGGCICVSDPLKAMQQIAAGHVARFPYLKKIGVTGSNGKTTSRQLIASVLGKSGSTVQTQGNLNSEIGLPMSVLQITKEHEYAVFEMGINHIGEMEALANVFQPDYGVFTNIGTAHIGLLGSKDVIAEEKRKLMSHSGARGAVFINEGEKYKHFLAQEKTLIEYGPSAQAIQQVEDLGIEGFRFLWKDHRITLRLAGMHNLNNALSALAVADFFNIKPELAVEGLESVESMFGRSQILKGGITLIQDCYNANTESMASALDFFAGLEINGQKAAVLGEMRELGDFTGSAHAEVAEKAIAAGLDVLVFFGDHFKSLNIKADNVLVSNDLKEVITYIEEQLNQGDFLLLKGSRGAELERITKKLEGRYSLC